MSPDNSQSVNGIRFTDEFRRELHRLWAQLGDEGRETVADVQRTGRSLEGEEIAMQWGLHFVPREIVAPTDIVMIDNLPIHIQTSERKLLQGKVLDFEGRFFVVR